MINESKHFFLEHPYEPSLRNKLLSTLYWGIAAVYRLELCISKKPAEKEKKYKVSICAIFKDEAEVLKEWLEYHLITGIEHFYMYNNDSSDQYREILEPYISKGQVTLVDWPGKKMQIKAYEHAIRTYRPETKWMGFIDLDEYVVPCKERTVYDVLKKFNRKAPAVMVYWKVFGSSGIIERDTRKLIPEQFVIAYPKMTDVGKCFFNTDYEYAQGHKRNSIMHHVLWSKCGGFVIPPVNLQNHISFPYHHHINNQLLPMQINHYVTKSYQDYYYKTHVKTDVYFENNPRKMEQFYNIDAKCTVADYRIFRFLSQLKQALKTEE